MEVTRTNFQEVLIELDDVLKDATFLAIDGEFTGLNLGSDTSAYDTPSEYYAKLRAGCMDFLLVQFGLSVFTYNSETNKYSQRSYNFYVFPRPFDRSAPDCRFLCQASCIDFLVNQGFDFNKLFKYGIPYLKKDDENWLNKKFDEKQKIRDNYDLISISDDDRPQIEEICSRIKDFINLEDKEIIIDRCNSFIRRLIYQEVKLRWPNKFGLKTKNDNQSNQCIVVYKIGTKEEEEQREIERREKQKLEVQEAVGLSALLKKIANSGKLIVGHNMLLDLCHIINQFFDSLPESYLKFKSLVHCLFPRLLDTKIICQSAQFKDSVPSVLHQLLETLHNSPFELPETEDVSDRSYKISNNKSHEAGYDAFITGLCFIALSNRLGSLQRPQVSTVLADSQLLNKFLNKLLITRLKDYPYINLTGKDPNPSRDHVFHITFPKEWKYSDLSQLFTPYGGAFVSWLTDKSAYVALYRRDQISAVMNDLVKPHNKHYSIKKYREHHANLEREHQVKPERKRKISDCESPTKTESSPPPTTTGSKSTTLNTDEDGWEVASGNNHSKFINLHNKSEECVLMSGRTGNQAQRNAAAPGVNWKGVSSCYGIFSDWIKRVPKKKVNSLPQVKRRTRRRTYDEELKSVSLRKLERTAMITATGIFKCCTWMNALRLMGILLAFYFITVL